jgi:hypothetical protein
MNNKIFNGNDTVIGDTICMPNAMSMLETNKSTIKKGMKITNPILNAFCNSETTNEGNTIRTLCSSTCEDIDEGQRSIDFLRKLLITSGSACLIINRTKGSIIPERDSEAFAIESNTIVLEEYILYVSE